MDPIDPLNRSVRIPEGAQSASIDVLLGRATGATDIQLNVRGSTDEQSWRSLHWITLCGPGTASQFIHSLQNYAYLAVQPEDGVDTPHDLQVRLRFFGSVAQDLPPESKPPTNPEEEDKPTQDPT